MAVSNPRPGLFRFGIFEVDFESGELWKQGRKIALHDQTLRALALLLEHPGEVVTREQFRQRLWPADTFVDFDKSLNTTISKLRDVLGDSAAHPRFIETLPRRGYRFLSPVEEAAKAKPQSPAARSRVARRWVWATVTLVGILGGAYQIHQIRQTDAHNLRVIQLTSYPGSEEQPSLSPDGNRVAFAWNGGPSPTSDSTSKDYDIYVKVLGSEELVRLTSDPADDRSPTWSPDGQTIAFLRFTSDQQSSVMLAPSNGGTAHRLATTRAYKRSDVRLAWSPDGQWVATSDAETPQSAERLVLISTKTGAKQTLAYPVSGFDNDVSPSFSPDGKHLAFARQISPVVADIYVLELPRDGGVARDAIRVTSWNRWNRAPLWTQNGQELLFVGDESRFGPRIWRVPALRKEEPRVLNQFGEDSSSITLARDGSRLVYSKESKDTNIWRINLPSTKLDQRSVATFSPIIESTRLENNPQYSPNGNYIAYQSERSGVAEIWVCKSDGSASRQLTRLNTKVSGYPRWSPDGKHIVFHSRPQGYANLFVVDVETGAYRQLTSGAYNDGAPSWSRNGEWIYFRSSRKDGYQIWRMPAEGGSAHQITRNGGLVAFDSDDGKSLFYSKPSETALWVLSLDSGTESRFAPSLSHADTFAVTKRGVYFVHPTAKKKAAVSFKSFDSGKTQEIALINATIDMGLTVSPDGQSILYTQADHSGSDLILVDNLR